MTEPVEQPAVDLPEEDDQVELTPADEVAPEDSGATGTGGQAGAPATEDLPPVDPVAALESLVAERTEDLQRVQAEYVNYKKRVDRDRALARQSGIEVVLRDLMPVFDSILAAEAHDDLNGGFKLTADELVKVTKAYGFESFGKPGDEFDPRLHEALMQMPVPGTEDLVLHEVMQVGFRIHDQVIRPARVIVAVPADD